MNHIEMPKAARVLAAILGAVFLALAIVILVTSGAGGWRPVLGAAITLVLAFDFLFGAATGEWPAIAPLLFLP